MTKRDAILEGMAAKGHYHHGNLREALVDAARCVIVDEGIANLSLRKVAKHAGVSQAAPYHHFDNKDALLVEVAFRGFNELRARLTAAGQGIEAHGDRLMALGQAYLRFGAEHPELYKLMFGRDHCPAEDDERLKQAAQASLIALIEAIAQGQADGAFRSDTSPIDLALAIWSGVHGAVSLIQAKFHGEKTMNGATITPEVMARSTLQFLLDGVAAR